MFFIHTFSMIKVFKKREEVEQLWKIYNQKNITEKKVFRINEFSDKGVRLVIRDLEKQRKRFEKVTTEVEIIVTPYKLLHNGEALGRLTTEEEYTEAIQELRKILHEIWDTTEVDLQDAELNRIDVTYDIVTPSQKYTREIIAALKVMHLKNGYTPISKEILDKNNWDPSISYCYCISTGKHNAQIKIYDKAKNLKDFGYMDAMDSIQGKGLLRFEVTLNKFKKKYKQYDANTIEKALSKTLRHAKEIYFDYVILPLQHTQELLSKELLYRLIEKRINGMKKREKMKECIKVCERNKALGIQLDIDFMGTYKKTKTILSYFNDLSLSPIPLVSDCPFIPSLFTLIFDSDNTDAYEYLYYAKNIPEERSTGLMKNMTNDEIYTFDEVLQILKTSKQQLRKLLKNGEIKGFKLGTYKWRIPKKALDNYIQEKMG